MLGCSEWWATSSGTPRPRCNSYYQWPGSDDASRLFMRCLRRLATVRTLASNKLPTTENLRYRIDIEHAYARCPTFGC